MPNNVEDLQMLRLIKAFQRISDQDARRMVVLHVEQQAEKQLLKSRQKLWRTEH